MCIATVTPTTALPNILPPAWSCSVASTFLSSAGILIMMSMCSEVHVYEYIPSIRQTELCHYHELYYDAACTLGAYHPLLYEKLLVQRLNTGAQGDLHRKGKVVLPGLRAVRCPAPNPAGPPSWGGALENRCAIRYYCLLWVTGEYLKRYFRQCSFQSVDWNLAVATRILLFLSHWVFITALNTEMEFKRKKCSRKMQKKKEANVWQMGFIPPEIFIFSHAMGTPYEGWFHWCTWYEMVYHPRWATVSEHLMCHSFIHSLLKIRACMTSIWITTRMCLF